MNENIKSILTTCDKHVERLRWSMTHIEPMIPFTPERFSSLSDKEVAICDSFASRFSKLQDLMGSKLFDMILTLGEEPIEALTFIDKLNRLEKMHVLQDAQQWREIRLVRNLLSHDYPEESEINAQNFNQAFQMAKTLLNTYEQVKQYTVNFLRRIEEN